MLLPLKSDCKKSTVEFHLYGFNGFYIKSFGLPVKMQCDWLPDLSVLSWSPRDVCILSNITSSKHRLNQIRAWRLVLRSVAHVPLLSEERDHMPGEMKTSCIMQHGSEVAQCPCPLSPSSPPASRRYAHSSISSGSRYALSCPMWWWCHLYPSLVRQRTSLHEASWVALLMSHKMEQRSELASSPTLFPASSKWSSMLLWKKRKKGRKKESVPSCKK